MRKVTRKVRSIARFDLEAQEIRDRYEPSIDGDAEMDAFNRYVHAWIEHEEAWSAVRAWDDKLDDEGIPAGYIAALNLTVRTQNTLMSALGNWQRHKRDKILVDMATLQTIVGDTLKGEAGLLGDDGLAGHRLALRATERVMGALTSLGVKVTESDYDLPMLCGDCDA